MCVYVPIKYVCTYVCVYVYEYIRTYVCAYVCMYACMYIYTFSIQTLYSSTESNKAQFFVWFSDGCIANFLVIIVISVVSFRLDFVFYKCSIQ